MDVYAESLRLHEANRGKLGVVSKVSIKDKNDLALAYSPGVAEPCRAIAKNPGDVYKYTLKANSICVLSDGSKVLGLGRLGADAAIPVMEGKCVLFKAFAGLDGWPICVRSQEPGDIIMIAKNIAPVFGAINLEDITAPGCFEVEDALQDIGIPVMHDDQHGTAIVILAALMNSVKVVGKTFSELSVVISGAGAAGVAVANLLQCLGQGNLCVPVKDVIVCDTSGLIFDGREENMEPYKVALAKRTNKRKLKGALADALKGADVFIGVSAPNVLTASMVRTMAKGAIVFALANPTPEIMPDEAKAGGAAVVATGRSDFPNQVNNVLAFPGVFRGAIDAKAKRITNEMKFAAALALSGCVKNPSVDCVIPSPFESGVHKRVADAVRQAAEKSSSG
ncbi:NADP-dependent malic enzyme [Candidatus Woesearchaeota archaeon]|nr:NADP-dependent malic enzyme [Candidatus Woesearchaeota archaeon]